MASAIEQRQTAGVESSEESNSRRAKHTSPRSTDFVVDHNQSLGGRTYANGSPRRNEDDGVDQQGVASPVASPPYWLIHHPHHSMSASVESLFENGGHITMRDNESEDWGGRNSACWARSVEIPNYVVVNGSATNIGAFVVFNIRVETQNVSSNTKADLSGSAAKEIHWTDSKRVLATCFDGLIVSFTYRGAT